MFWKIKHTHCETQSNRKQFPLNCKRKRKRKKFPHNPIWGQQCPGFPATSFSARKQCRNRKINRTRLTADTHTHSASAIVVYVLARVKRREKPHKSQVRQEGEAVGTNAWELEFEFSFAKQPNVNTITGKFFFSTPLAKVACVRVCVRVWLLFALVPDLPIATRWAGVAGLGPLTSSSGNNQVSLFFMPSRGREEARRFGELHQDDSLRIPAKKKTTKKPSLTHLFHHRHSPSRSRSPHKHTPIALLSIGLFL